MEGFEVFPVERREVRWRVVELLQQGCPGFLTSDSQHNELHAAILRHGTALRETKVLEPVDYPRRV